MPSPDPNFRKIASRNFLARPLFTALPVTLVTLAVGAGAIILADFGRPMWNFAILFLWLGTIGLPSTLGVLAVAWLWGRHPLLTGFVPFSVCAGITALFFQTLVHGWRARRRRTVMP